jgi:hypothetical protein
MRQLCLKNAMMKYDKGMLGKIRPEGLRFGRVADTHVSS